MNTVSTKRVIGPFSPPPSAFTEDVVFTIQAVTPNCDAPTSGADRCTPVGSVPSGTRISIPR